MRKKETILLYAGSFFLPVLLLAAVLAFQGFAPFGDKSLLIMDMSGQYVEFYNALQHGDLFFSWSKGLGTDYIGVFAYYVSSPFSILTLLFSDETMPVCIYLLTLLKIGFAGMSFTLYGTKRFGLRGAIMPVFSCAYALMSYNLAYSMCLMWLDGVIWLPIVLWGVERLLRRGRWGMFCFSLLAVLLSNYYISYMLILFTVLYFALRCLEEKMAFSLFLRRTFLFLFAGFSAAGMGAAFLIPVFLSHFEGKLADLAADYPSRYNFAWQDFLDKLFRGGYDSVTNSGAPFVFCGLPVAVLALLFFLLSGIPKRKKLAGGILLVVLGISMRFSGLDRIWHVFRYPNWFPYRYSFLFSFVVLCLAVQAYQRLSVSFTGWAPAALAFLLLWDLGADAGQIFRGLDAQFGYQSLEEYRRFREEKTALVERTEGFCRVGATQGADRTLNDALGFDYNGITHYSSSYLTHVNNWLKRLGMAQNYIWCADYGSTPVTDCFLGVKYVISDVDPAPGYAQIAQSGRLHLYENPCFSGLAFFVPQGDLGPFLEGNVFENQNSLFCYLTGFEEGPFLGIQPEIVSTDGKTVIRLISDGRPLYAFFTRRYGECGFFVNGERRNHLFTNETDCVQYLGCFERGSTVILQLDTEISGQDCAVYGFDGLLFAQGAQRLGQISWQNVSYGDAGTARGALSCGEEGMLVTSIPFSRGFRAYVDGVRTETEAAMNTFLAVRLSEGNHQIRLLYVPPGLIPGAVISAISVLGVALGLWRGTGQVTEIRQGG